MVFPEAFEGGEVVFNRIEVGGVRGQEEEDGAGLFNQVSGLRTFVKGYVIHHHDLVRAQAGTQLSFEPLVKDLGVTRTFEQEGRG